MTDEFKNETRIPEDDAGLGQSPNSWQWQDGPFSDTPNEDGRQWQESDPYSQNGCTVEGDAPAWTSQYPSEPSENGPVPPPRWSGNDPYSISPEADSPQQSPQQASAIGSIGSTRFPLKGDEVVVYQKARLYFGAAIIASIVSIFIGGVLASCIALICAFVANSRFEILAATRMDEPDVQRILRRSGRIAIAVAALALILNIIALVFLYPTLVNSMQNGTLTGTTAAPATGGGSSTWG